MPQTINSPKSGSLEQLGTIARYTRFIFKNLKAFRAMKKLYAVRTNLSRANMEIAKLDCHDPLYFQRVEEFNETMIVLTRAKWKTTCAMESAARGDLHAKADAKRYWQEAQTALRQSTDMSQRLLEAVQSGYQESLGFSHTELSSQHTEILFAGDTPLVPEINPIVILRGSDYDMGYQYAQQLIQIFGPWLLQRKAGQKFSAADLDCLHRWEEQVQRHAPEILTMCRGWAAGAADGGVAMSYEDVLDLWTGHKPPAQILLGLADGEPFMAPPFCSGAAAWGRATVDGKLVTVSTGDHDAHHMVTIVAYPDTGNAFIISPFSATGDLGKLGGIYMFGHPGMNSRGLAYVEHGGLPKMVEPRRYWGYGLRMGTAVFHILRYANSAREALDMELSLPVGDVGSGGFGSVGGFWADSEYGYILDSRREPVLVREAGMMGETDFLCASNSPLHPDAAKADWMQADRAHWHHDPKGGWYADYRPVKKIGIDEAIIVQSLGNGFIGSRDRTIYLHRTLEQAVGKIDFEFMKAINRHSFPLPKPTWQESVAHFKRTGSWGQVSTGHASNADVVIMKPDADGHGLYAMCVGAARRGAVPVMPTWCSPIYNETNTFWELTLAPTPQSMVENARQKAEAWIAEASKELDALPSDDPAFVPFEALVVQARHEFMQGETTLQTLSGNDVNGKHVYRLGRAVRAFTRAQVRACQVVETLAPASLDLLPDAAADRVS